MRETKDLEFKGSISNTLKKLSALLLTLMEARSYLVLLMMVL